MRRLCTHSTTRRRLDASLVGEPRVLPAGVGTALAARPVGGGAPPLFFTHSGADPVACRGGGSRRRPFRRRDWGPRACAEDGGVTEGGLGRGGVGLVWASGPACDGRRTRGGEVLDLLRHLSVAIHHQPVLVHPVARRYLRYPSKSNVWVRKYSLAALGKYWSAESGRWPSIVFRRTSKHAVRLVRCGALVGTDACMGTLLLRMSPAAWDNTHRVW
jgi:hypothetical protein